MLLRYRYPCGTSAYRLRFFGHVNPSETRQMGQSSRILSGTPLVVQHPAKAPVLIVVFSESVSTTLAAKEKEFT